MKTIIAFIALVSMAITGTASQAAKSTTRPSSQASAVIKDIRVELALFGSGTHLADVTDRVIELLRAEPDGFVANAAALHTDPLPGKNKSLLVRYWYHNQECLFMVTGKNKASYALLTETDDVK